MSPDRDFGSPEVSNAKKLRACSNCARLKIKCRWPPGSEHDETADCTRCSRMAIQCRVPQPVQRKKRGKSSRVTELEKKIDGLVNLFQAQQHTRQADGQVLTPDTDVSHHEETQVRQLLPCTGISAPLPDPEPSSDSLATDPRGGDTAGVTHDAGPVTDSLQLVPGLCITMSQAEDCLNIYRTRMVPQFPFVPIAPNVTARELHKERRFLFWCIIQAVVPQSAAVQKEVDDWVRRHTAMHIVVQKQKKLEYLQGLLVYISFQSWGDIHVSYGMAAYSLLQLAIGLVLDMSIYIFSGPLSWLPKTMLADAWSFVNKGKPLELPKASMDEQRAILGGYFLASNISFSTRRVSQIPYSSQIARCCKNIREAAEYTSDAMLTAFVRMQHTAERVRAIFPLIDREDGDPVPVFKEHINMTLTSLSKEIDSFLEEEPAIAKDHHLLWTHYVTMRVRLYEPLIGMQAVKPAETMSMTEPYGRTHGLWLCLESVNEAMSALLAVPAEAYAYIPFSMTANTAFIMMTGSRLLLEQGAFDWDTTLARQKLDHAEGMRLFAEKCEEADSVALIVGQKRRLFEDNSSRWSNYAYRARWMRQWFINKTSPPAAAREAASEQPQRGPSVEVSLPSDMNMAWESDFSLDQTVWEQMMMDGFGQVPFDVGGSSWTGMTRSADESLSMMNMIPQ